MLFIDSTVVLYKDQISVCEGVMKKKSLLTVNEIKDINLKTLLYFDSFCKENGLRYYLAFGTLLGAVRHNGYIPWDDDIDVLMPRGSYEKLTSLSAQIDNKYSLLSYRTQPDYLLPYMKLCDNQSIVLPSRLSNGFLYGLSIDIFPLDKNPYYTYCEAEAFRSKIKDQLSKAMRKTIVWGVKNTGLIYSVKRFAKRLLFQLNNRRNKLFMEYSNIDMLLKSASSDKAEYVFYPYDKYNSLWKAEHFTENEPQELVFENHLFPVPHGWDEVLRTSYGDYTVLPPVEERKSNHTYDAYLIE